MDLINGDTPVTVKACTDCKHLLGIRHRVDEVDQWRCVHPNNTGGAVTWKLDLVTALRHRVVVREDIYFVREEQCKGDWWELYEKPIYSTPLQPKSEKTIADDL